MLALLGCLVFTIFTGLAACEATCPAIPGGEATPGCQLSLIQDNNGQIECQVDDDCPYRLLMMED